MIVSIVFAFDAVDIRYLIGNVAVVIRFSEYLFVTLTVIVVIVIVVMRNKAYRGFRARDSGSLV